MLFKENNTMAIYTIQNIINSVINKKDEIIFLKNCLGDLNGITTINLVIESNENVLGLNTPTD